MKQTADTCCLCFALHVDFCVLLVEPESSSAMQNRVEKDYFTSTFV